MRVGRAGRPSGQRRGRIILQATALILGASVLAGCNMNGPPGVKTKFTEAKYGVAASPRKVAWNKPVPKGGGYYMVGKPYKVAGEWFHPAEDPDYRESGIASWYGPNFHGRQTANGEIYDMAALSAAHPTLPLPSYVRVKNLANGRSVVVRVNDRGPFSRGRVIDVSARAADMLGFREEGVARVEVEYVGRARLDGQDEPMLMASYQGPGAVGGPASDDHFMLASLPTPRQRPLPSGITADTYAFSARSSESAPYEMPRAVPRGTYDPIAALLRSPISSYAPVGQLTPAHRATAALAQAGAAAAADLKPGTVALADALERRSSIQIGSFGERANAERTAAKLAGYGIATITESGSDRAIYVVRLTVDRGRTDPAVVIAAAEAIGARGAFVLAK